MKRYLTEIYALLEGNRRELLWLIPVLLLSSGIDIVGLGMVMPYISLVMSPDTLGGTWRRVINVLNFPHERDALLVRLGVVLVFVFVAKAVVSLWLQSKIIQFGRSCLVRLQSALMRAYQDMPYELYLRRNSAEYANAIGKLAGIYSANVVTNLVRLLCDGIMAMAIIGFLIWVNGPAMLLMVGIALGALAVYDRIFSKKLRYYGLAANRNTLAVQQGIREGIEGFKEVRILGKERYFYDIVVENAKQEAEYANRWAMISIAPRQFLEVLLVTFVVSLVIITIGAGGDLAKIGPTLALFAVASMRLMPQFNSLSSGLGQLRIHRDSVSRLFNDVKAAGETKSRSLRLAQLEVGQTPLLFRELRLDNVGFCYHNSNLKALDGVSIEVRSGESIGLVGSSGAGKTTLLDVLLGLLEPQSGAIVFNGEPMRDNVEQWRSHVAYLPQQIFIIDNSLKCNVALGVTEMEIDVARVHEALRQACLSEVVDRLPLGVETMLGERGMRLSGGQRQRVALARAFYHGRDVLVMDEATSALDNETERNIVAEIQRLKGQKTMIVIAHRLSTVQGCDRIYRLDNGKIVAFGSPEEVLYSRSGMDMGSGTAAGSSS
jgi:ABC-type multidrug transport system fused ATPase/permease subunit